MILLWNNHNPRVKGHPSWLKAVGFELQGLKLSNLVHYSLRMKSYPSKIFQFVLLIGSNISKTIFGLQSFDSRVAHYRGFKIRAIPVESFIPYRFCNSFVHLIRTKLGSDTSSKIEFSFFEPFKLEGEKNHTNSNMACYNYFVICHCPYLHIMYHKNTLNIHFAWGT